MKTIKLNKKVGKVYAFVFQLCQFDISKLTIMFFGIAMAEQLISISIEYLIFGESFPHWFDSVFLFSISWAYFYFSHNLGAFLLDLAANGVVEDE